MPKRRPYEEIQQLVQQHGGTMRHQREGYQWGAWIVRLGGKERIFLSNGSGYPDLDKLYVPKPGFFHPSHYSDYSNTLVAGAWEKFLAQL